MELKGETLVPSELNLVGVPGPTLVQEVSNTSIGLVKQNVSHTPETSVCRVLMTPCHHPIRIKFTTSVGYDSTQSFLFKKRPEI